MEQLPLIGTGLWLLIILAALWSGVWKAFALWRAARNNHLGWYICMIIFNTLGILEIIYILGFSKREATTTLNS